MRYKLTKRNVKDLVEGKDLYAGRVVFAVQDKKILATLKQYMDLGLIPEKVNIFLDSENCELMIEPKAIDVNLR